MSKYGQVMFTTRLYFTQKKPHQKPHYKTPEENLAGTGGELDIQILTSYLHPCIVSVTCKLQKCEFVKTVTSCPKKKLTNLIKQK